MIGPLWRKLRFLLRRREFEQDLHDEIRFHLEMQEAENESRAGFGNVTLLREASREAWGWPALDDLLREARYAVRSLRRSPVATSAAVASLGIGIGVAAAVFSIADAILLRELAVPDPHELVSLYQRAGAESRGFSSYSYPQYQHLREHSRSFRELAAFARLPVNARVDETVERLSCELVSNNYFDTLRVSPVLGRGFRQEDDGVLVISHRLWRERFGSDRAITARTMVVNGRSFAIAGVMPDSFRGVVLDWGKPPDVWLPVAAHTIIQDLPLQNPRSHWMLVVGRLAPGVSAAQSQEEAVALTEAFYRIHPFPGKPGFRPVVLPAREGRFWPGHRQSVSSYVGLLAAIAGLTFFMACFNVANLLLGRAEKRKRELGIQVAIGAGRFRLARALLIETAFLAAGGALVGGALASGAPAVLDRFHNPFGIPLALDLAPGLRVAAFVAMAAAVALAVVGISPVRRAWRTDVAALIKSGGGPERGVRRLRLADTLVMLQVAICLVAVAGAGLFLRTLQHAEASDPMFRAGNAVLAGVDLLSAGYGEPRGKALLNELLARVRELPGVAAAAYVKTVPLGGLRGAGDIRVGGQDANVQVNTVSDGYFQAAGFPVVQGRDFRAGETESVLVNEALAARFWPGGDALGKTVTVRGKLQFTVAGVVRDGRMRNFREREVLPCLYLPLAADYQRMITLYVRAADDPLSTMAAVRGILYELDRNLPFEARTLKAHLETALARERLAAALLTTLAAFTTLLAAVGLYGLIAVAAVQRAREIGIRMALGARRGQVVGTVLQRFALLVGAGSLAGLGAAAALARLVESWIFGVPPLDPVSLGWACVLLLAVALAAAAAPALRAAATDPMSVLRHE